VDYCDLIYIDGQAGDGLSDFIGDKRVYAFDPNGTGDTFDFTRTGGSSNANALTLADGDTSYAEDSTVGHRFLLTTGSVPSSLSGILAAGVDLYARKTDAGARAMDATLKISGTHYDSSDISLGDSYAVQRKSWVTNPATSSAFTQSDVAGLQF